MVNQTPTIAVLCHDRRRKKSEVPYGEWCDFDKKFTLWPVQAIFDSVGIISPTPLEK